MQLSRAYETLKDENTRRIYDAQHYSWIKKARGQASHTTPQTETSDDSQSQDGLINMYAAKISTILKTKEDRAAKWVKTKQVHDNGIFELNREVQKLRSAIRNFEIIEKKEAEEAAAAKSWTAWMLSAIITKPEESEEEKERKDRERLQRFHAKGIKESLLQQKDADMRDWENLLREKLQDFQTANSQDDMMKYRYEDIIRGLQRQAREAREAREYAAREERERLQKEQQAKWRKAEQERREEKEKEAAEQRKKEAADWKALQEKLAKEAAERQQKMKRDTASRSATRNSDFGFTPHRMKLDCSHDGWWHKLEGTQRRDSCERCGVSRYTYLLQCPSCSMLACASCQQVLRPRRRNTNRESTFRTQQRSQTIFEESGYYDGDW